MDLNFQVEEIRAGEFRILLSAPDFLGFLSVITGHFTASGLNFIQGNLESHQNVVSGSFEVSSFTPSPDWPSIRKALEQRIQKSLDSKSEEVKQEIQGDIVRFLRTHKEIYREDLNPIQMEIDQKRSEKETVVEIISQDTPAFLYELAHSLATLQLNVTKIQIRTLHGKAHDTLWLTDVQGQKIVSESQLKTLQWAVLIAKHFTHLLPKTPDPQSALEQMDRLSRELFQRSDFNKILLILKRSRFLKDLSRVLGSSKTIWEDFVRTQKEAIFNILVDHRALKVKKDRSRMRKELIRFLSSAQSFEEKISRLNEFRDKEIFRAELRHILGQVTYAGEFAEEFSDLAEVIVEVLFDVVWKEMLSSSLSFPGIESIEWSVMGLGKLGGRELGFASDLEILFVYSDADDPASEPARKKAAFFCYLVKQASALIQKNDDDVFAMDLRLRPYGQRGPLAVSFPEFKKYYSALGAAWDYERQAMTKLRFISGAQPLGEKIMNARDEFVYGKYRFRLEETAVIRMRQQKELVEKDRVNVKYSSGGLLDVEYLVQSFQIVYGSDHVSVRDPHTLRTLFSLYEIKAIAADEYEKLQSAYIFLRSLVNALRIVRGNANDLHLPSENTNEFTQLGRRMGYEGDDFQIQKEFSFAIASAMQNASTLYQSGILRLKEKGASVLEVRMDENPIPFNLDELLREEWDDEFRKELLKAGFSFPEIAARNLKRISPSVLSFKYFAHFLRNIWPFWKEVADPDLALEGWTQCVLAYKQPDDFWKKTKCLSQRGRVFIRLLGLGGYFAKLLSHHPDWLLWIENEKEYDLQKTIQSLQEIRSMDFLSGLRGIKHRETLRLAIIEGILPNAPLPAIYQAYSFLADGLVHETARLTGLQRFQIIALGKWGGRELNFSSDIDFMVRMEADPDSLPLQDKMMTFFEALRAGESWEFLFRPDLRLRPRGEEGPLWMKKENYLNHYENRALIWEYQALLKARISAQDFTDETLIPDLERLVYAERWTPLAFESLSEMKKRYEEAIEARGETDTHVKLGSGGIRDIEFSIQAIQLKQARQYPELRTGETLKALEKIKSLKLLPEKDCEILKEGYFFLRKIENRLQLFENRQAFNVPKHPRRRLWLAKAMGYSASNRESVVDAFERDFNRIKGECRRIFEQIYYQKRLG